MPADRGAPALRREQAAGSAGGLGRVPRTGDVFERGGFRFEVADMDGNRVDRVLVQKRPAGLAGINGDG